MYSTICGFLLVTFLLIFEYVVKVLFFELKCELFTKNHKVQYVQCECVLNSGCHVLYVKCLVDT